MSARCASHNHACTNNLSYGCSVVRLMLDRAESELHASIVGDILACTSRLIKDPFANYVLQHILNHQGSGATGLQLTHNAVDRIAAYIQGEVADIARHRFGSHVFEKLLEHATPTHLVVIISELLSLRQDTIAQLVVDK